MECVAPWNRGTLDKVGIWSFYIAANFLGVVLYVMLSSRPR
jgi:hypothetical protein